MSANDIVQLLGITYLVLGLSFLFNKKYYKDIFKELVKSKAGMLYGGIFSLLIGFILILNFNEWSLSSVGLVTFFGWAALVKGILLLLFPKFMVDFTKAVTKPKNFDLTGYGVTIMGVLLIYLGFIA